MFDKNKSKIIKTQQTLIESLKKQNIVLKNENEQLKNKILSKFDTSDKDIDELANVMTELKQSKNRYDELIKEIESLKVTYKKYLNEINEIKEKYKSVFK